MQKPIAATQNLHQEALLILSADQQPLYFNERLLQLWSATPEDLQRAPWAHLSQGVLNAPAFVARVGELTLSGLPGLPETFMLKDGRTLEQISYPVTLDDQRSGRVWAWRDITGREALALAQQGSQDLLAKLSAQLPGIIFQYRLYPDGRSCFPYMSEAVSRLYPGITPALIRHDARPVHAFRHPDDAPALATSIRHSAQTLSLWDHEYRLILPGQGVVWRHGRAHPERLSDGSTLWTGFITDITERKQTELALRLNASVFETSGEGILVVGPDNRIVSVNPAFTHITGYSAEEVMGQDPRLLRSGRHGPVFFAALWAALQHSGRWEGELWNRRKNGEVYPQRTAIHTVPGQGQLPDHRIAIFSDISERKRADEHIWRQANYDALTGLPNRRLLLDRLRQEIRKAQRSGDQVALLLVDLDYFKEVNDTLGHDVGDLLLMEAAARLTHCVRSSDTVARLGGDEFMVMITGRNLNHVAEKTAHALSQRLGAPFVLDTERAYVSASVGITLYPDDAQDVETLFKNADQAMYAAKKAGRNQHSWFKHSMQELAQQHRLVADRLRQALGAQQFEVYYQPVVELATQRITKAEALLRWHTPGHQTVGPGVFIPIAEELGLINDIGDWAFRQVAAMALHLNQGHHPPVQLAVNKSPRQFRTDSCHIDWSHHLRAIGLDCRHIAVEITEGLLLDSRPETVERLRDMREQGLQLALDDFGTGYSAMSYLLKFNLDFLKIDQSFVHQVGTPGGQAIVEAMVAMAHKLGLQVIAEGVETPDQLAFLQSIGCDHAQGYLFARPMPAADFERLLTHNREGRPLWVPPPLTH